MGSMFGGGKPKTPSAAEIAAEQAAADAAAQKKILEDNQKKRSALNQMAGTGQGGGDAANSLRAVLLGTS